MKPVVQGGPFPSVRVLSLPHKSVVVPHNVFQFLGRSDGADKTRACFGKNWDRLVELKQKYDPTNMFRNTFWPLNEEGRAVEPNLREPEATYDHVPKSVPTETRTDVGTV